MKTDLYKFYLYLAARYNFSFTFLMILVRHYDTNCHNHRGFIVTLIHPLRVQTGYSSPGVVSGTVSMKVVEFILFFVVLQGNSLNCSICFFENLLYIVLNSILTFLL